MPNVASKLVTDAAIIRKLLSSISRRFPNEIRDLERWELLSSQYQHLECCLGDYFDASSLLETLQDTEDENDLSPIISTFLELRTSLEQLRTLLAKKKHGHAITYSLEQTELERHILDQVGKAIELESTWSSLLPDIISKNDVSLSRPPTLKRKQSIHRLGGSSSGEVITSTKMTPFIRHFSKPYIRNDWVLNFDASSKSNESYIKKCLIERKEDDDFRVSSLCIWGHGGTGKTVALRALCHDEDVITHYEHGIHYFELGPDTNELSMIEQIARCVRSTGEAIWENMDLPISLLPFACDCDFVFAHKKVLFVIDDVWSPEWLYAIQRLAYRVKYGTIIFSTRDSELFKATTAGNISVHFSNLFPTEKASLDIIKEQLIEGDKSLTDLSSEASEALNDLLDKCDGLKLCLAIAGGALRQYIQNCLNNVNTALISYTKNLDNESRMIADDLDGDISYINTKLRQILPSYEKWDDASVNKQQILQNAHERIVDLDISSTKWNVRMSHDGRYAITRKRRIAFISDLYEKHVTSFFHRENGYISCADISVMGKVIYGTTRGDLFLWNPLTLSDSKCPFVTGDGSAINLVTFSFDGMYVAIGSSNKPIQIRRLDSAHHVYIEMGKTFFRSPSSAISCVTFNKDNSQLITGSQDGSIRIAEIHNDFIQDEVCIGHSEPVVYIAMNESGACIASGSLDGTIRIWNVANGTIIHFWNMNEKINDENRKLRALTNKWIVTVSYLREIASSEYESDLPVVFDKLNKLLIRDLQPTSDEDISNGYEYLIELMRRSWGFAVVHIGNDEQNPKNLHQEARKEAIHKAAESFDYGITFYSNTGREFIFLFQNQPLSEDACSILLRYVPGSKRLQSFLRDIGAAINNCFLQALEIPINKTGKHSVFYIHPTWLSLLEEQLEDFLRDHCETQDSEIWAGFLGISSRVLTRTRKSESVCNRESKLNHKRVSDICMKDGSFFVIEENQYVKWVLSPRTSWLLSGADIGNKITAGTNFGLELKTEVEGTMMLSRGPEYGIDDDLRHANTAVIVNLGVLNELYPSKEDASRPELDERFIALSKALLHKSFRMPKNRSHLYDAIVEEPTCDLLEFTKWHGKHTIPINKLNHSNYCIVNSSDLRRDFLKLLNLRAHPEHIENTTRLEQTFFFVMDSKNTTRIIYEASRNDYLLRCIGAHRIAISWPIEQKSFNENFSLKMLL